MVECTFLILLFHSSSKTLGSSLEFSLCVDPDTNLRNVKGNINGFANKSMAVSILRFRYYVHVHVLINLDNSIPGEKLTHGSFCELYIMFHKCIAPKDHMTE